MIDRFYERQFPVRCLREGVLGSHVDGFSRWLADAGFSRLTVQGVMRAVREVDRHLHRTGRDASTLDEHTLARLRVLWKRRAAPATCKSWCAGAAHLLEYLRASGAVAAKVVEPQPVPAELAAFAEWMTIHRGARATTVALYAAVVAKLLRYLRGDVQRLTATRLRAFVLAEASKHGSSAAQTLVSVSRGFVRFLVAQGRCESTLLAAIPTIASWRLSSLPRYLPASDVERVIASCTSRTVDGARDRAVLLLLARLGLRAGDVAGLELKAIDWRGSRVRVAGKSRREDWLPLPQDVGDAVLAYLEKGRPRDRRPAVFFTARAPIVPLSRWAVSTIVRRAIQRAGVQAPSHGAHVLRHSAATTMLRSGASLEEIGAVLRHASVETTLHYAKVDTGLLNELTMPWPIPEAVLPYQVTHSELLALSQPWPEVL